MKKDIPTRAEDFRLADDIEISRRRRALERFVIKYFEPELRPIFVSDEANMLDISGDDIPEIIAKVRQLYGIEINEAQVRQPVWRLLDVVEPA